MEYVLTTERPTEPDAPVREANETDDAWKLREDTHIKAESEHQLAKARWDLDNKRCLAVGDSPRGPLKQLGNPHLKPAKAKHASLKAHRAWPTPRWP
jgi:hypothetical protein